ncbi:MAG TPA: lantibiotic dehydratase [Longimicrobiaceae bacterium]|nr:lantibiotic dehydratase [Longimicrobiaceae bacterium]
MASNAVLIESWSEVAPSRGGERLCSRFVCRVSGVATDRFQGLRATCTMRRLEEARAAEELLEARRQRVSDLLFAAIGAASERDRKLLLGARRDLFNRRPLSSSRLEAVHYALPTPAAEAVHALQGAILELQRATTAWAQVYRQETAAIRACFQSLLHDQDFRKGLLVSSRSLHGSLERYMAAGAELSGREEKTERGLLRYFTRAAMKATPFSTFCTVLPGTFVPADGNDEDEVGEPLRFAGDLRAKRSYVRINKALYGVLMDHLKGRPEVRRRLVVELNPTLDAEGGRFVFLTAVQQREVFQRVPASDVLKLVAAVIRRVPASTLGDLVEALARAPEVEATPEEAEAYLDKLLEIGYLRFRTGIREQDADWDLPLRDLLEPIDDDHARQCSALLRVLRERLEAYATAAVEERAGIVHEIQEALEAAFSSMEVGGRLRREMAFYEDATADASASVALTPGVQRAANTLVDWMRLTVRLGWPRPEQATMRHFFDVHYGGGAASVPLLRFYEDFFREHFKEHVEKERKLQAGIDLEALRDYKAGNPFGLEFIDTLNAARTRFLERVLERWREAPDAEEVRLSMAEVEEALGEVEPQPEACRSMGAFALLVPPRDGADPAFVLHGGSYTAGYGKYFSRFLYMLPEEFREAVRAENGALSDELLAEVCGDAHFNANLHPPLLPWEISYPTGESGAAEEQLRTSTIVVEPAPEDPHALILRHGPTGRRVVPVDLGFLNPRMRPPLYQLLSRFTPPVVFGPQLPETLVPPPVPAPEPQAADGTAPGDPARAAAPPAPAVEYRPRISVEGRVILARRRWAVPGSLLPQRTPGEGAAEFFARVDGWRREHGIPESCYLRIIPVPGPSRRQHGGGAPPPEAHDAQEAAMNLGAEAPPGAAAEEAAEPETPVAEAGEGAAGPEAPSPVEGVPAAQRGAPHPKRPVTAASRDFHKPQFMDFANPLLVGLFGKMGSGLKNYRVVAEERLPGPGELARHEGAGYATEMIVQVDFPGEAVGSRVGAAHVEEDASL